MKASGTTSRIAFFVGTFAAFVAFASSAQAAGTTPEGMTKAEHQALMSRSEALNDRYGNAVTHLTPAEFAAIWNAGGHRLEPQELVALVTRSEALNEGYNRVPAIGPETPSAVLDPPSPFTATGFGWSDAGIGAAGMLGLVLLAGGLVVAARHGRRVASPRVS